LNHSVDVIKSREIFMLPNIQNAVLIKHGKCTYDKAVEYEVKIVKWHIFYGTGDYEDSEKIRDDKNTECYYVFYENLINKGSFNVGRGFLSIKEAVDSVENVVDVNWFSLV